MGVETEVALVRQEVKSLSHLIYKIDETLDKVTNVANSIGQILAVQEHRVSGIERRIDDREAAFAAVKTDLKQEMHDMEENIKSTRKEIANEISGTEMRITKAISEVKDLVHTKFDAQDVRNDDVEERLKSLERWKWMIAGGAATVGGILTYLIQYFA